LEVHEAIIDSGVGYQILHSRWQECCGIQHPVTLLSGKRGIKKLRRL